MFADAVTLDRSVRGLACFESCLFIVRPPAGKSHLFVVTLRPSMIPTATSRKLQPTTECTPDIPEPDRVKRGKLPVLSPQSPYAGPNSEIIS